MKIAAGRFDRFLLMVGLIVFLWMAFFGAPHSVMGMEQKSDGAMGACIFDGKAETCTMSISQHLSSWQGLFTAPAPEKTQALLALLALIGIIFTAVLALRRHFALQMNHSAHRWRAYVKQSSLLAIFNPLREAFSRGILNPKIYRSAR